MKRWKALVVGAGIAGVTVPTAGMHSAQAGWLGDVGGAIMDTFDRDKSLRGKFKSAAAEWVESGWRYESNCPRSKGTFDPAMRWQSQEVCSPSNPVLESEDQVSGLASAIGRHPLNVEEEAYEALVNEARRRFLELVRIHDELIGLVGANGSALGVSGVSGEALARRELLLKKKNELIASHPALQHEDLIRTWLMRDYSSSGIRGLGDNPDLTAALEKAVDATMKDHPLVAGRGDRESRRRALNQYEEWLWVKHALEKRQPVVQANKDNLDRLVQQIQLPPERRDSKSWEEIRDLSEQVVQLGGVSKAIAKLESEKALFRSLCSKTFDGACTPAMLEKTTKRLGEIPGEIERLNEVRKNIFARSPLLTHEALDDWVDRSAGADDFDANHGKMLEALQTALTDTRDLSASRLARYREVLRSEGPDEKTLQDRELLEELLVSVDPGMERGYQDLFAAGCRLENRVLGGKAATELASAAFNSTLTAAAVLATGGVAAIVRGGATLGRLAMGSLVLAAPEATFLAADAALASDIKQQCDNLRNLAMSGVERDFDGTKISEAVVACKELYDSHVNMSLVGAVGGAVGVRSSLADALKRSAARLSRALSELEAVGVDVVDAKKLGLEDGRVLAGLSKHTQRAVGGIARRMSSVGVPEDVLRAEDELVASYRSLQDEELELGKLTGRQKREKERALAVRRRDMERRFDEALLNRDPELHSYVKKTFPGEAPEALQIIHILEGRGHDRAYIRGYLENAATSCATGAARGG